MKRKILFIISLLVVLANFGATASVSVEGNVLKIENDGNVFNKDLEPWPKRFTGEPKPGQTVNKTVSTSLRQNATSSPTHSASTYTVSSDLRSYTTQSGSHSIGASHINTTVEGVVTVPAPTGFPLYWEASQQTIAACNGYPWSLDLLDNHYGNINANSISNSTIDLSVKRILGKSLPSPPLVSQTVTGSRSVSASAKTFNYTCSNLRQQLDSTYMGGYTTYSVNTYSCSESANITFGYSSGSVSHSVTYYGVTAAQMAERD